MAADPILFLADLFNEQFDTQAFINNNARVPNVFMGRWISPESTEFPALSIFSHQQSHQPQGFDAKHYLNIRQVRVEIRSDELEEMHFIEEQLQRVVAENTRFPQTERFPNSGIEHIVMNSSVDVFETILDVVIYRRSFLVDVWIQYAYT